MRFVKRFLIFFISRFAFLSAASFAFFLCSSSVNCFFAAFLFLRVRRSLLGFFSSAFAASDLAFRVSAFVGGFASPIWGTGASSLPFCSTRRRTTGTGIFFFSADSAAAALGLLRSQVVQTRERRGRALCSSSMVFVVCFVTEDLPDKTRMPEPGIVFSSVDLAPEIARAFMPSMSLLPMPATRVWSDWKEDSRKD